MRLHCSTCRRKMNQSLWAMGGDCIIMMDLVTTGEYVKKTRRCTCQFEQDGCNDQKGSFAAMIKRDVFDSVKYFDLTWKPHIRIAAISARDSSSETGLEIHVTIWGRNSIHQCWVIPLNSQSTRRLTSVRWLKTWRRIGFWVGLGGNSSTRYQLNWNDDHLYFQTNPLITNQYQHPGRSAG